MLQVKTDDELVEQLIEQDPYHPGPADVRVTSHHIHVWALVGDLKSYDFAVDRVAADYGISAEYVRAALAYYRRHPDIIEGRLAANREPN